LLLLLGCAFFESRQDWSTQLAPSGPCYAFDLADGIDRGDTAELHAIYDCLDRQGTLRALSRLDAAIDAPVRGGLAGLRLLDAGDALLAASDDLSLAALVDGVAEAGANPDDLRAGAALLLELAYAAPAAELGSTVSINSSSALEAGLLVPLSDTLGAVATATLDADLAPLAPLSDALRSEEAPRLLWTFALLPEAPDEGLAALLADWPALVADVLGEVVDPSNDRNPGPTGDSLRDFLSAAMAEDALVALGGAAAPILEGDYERDAIEDWLLEEDAAERLDDLDDGLLYLASVDGAGGSLDDGEDSALVALLRLFRDGNQSIDCELDAVLFDVTWSLGNLSVAILEQIANLDPDNASGGVDILGDALGYPLTAAILDAVADSGVCPAIDAQMVSDLEAIDRLSDPSTEALLRSLIGFLSATEAQIPAVVDTASALHDHQLVEPLEELLRDLDHTELIERALDAAPGLVSPEGRQATTAFPPGTEAADLDLYFELALVATDADTVAALSPVMNAVVAQPSTWTAAQNLRALLLAGNDTQTAQILDRAQALLDADPELDALPALADRLDDAALVTPALEVIESSAVRAAVTDTELSNEGLVPWLGRLYAGGTLDVLLDTLALVQDLMGGDDV